MSHSHTNHVRVRQCPEITLALFLCLSHRDQNIYQIFFGGNFSLQFTYRFAERSKQCGKNGIAKWILFGFVTRCGGMRENRKTTYFRYNHRHQSLDCIGNDPTSIDHYRSIHLDNFVSCHRQQLHKM